MQAQPAHKSICFITQTLGFGGTEVHTLALINFLVSRGYGIELISCRHQQYDKSINSINSDKIKLIHTDLHVSDYRNNARSKWKSLLKGMESNILIFPRGYNDMGFLGFLRICKKRFQKVYYIEHLEAAAMPPKQSRLWFGEKIRGLGLWWHKEKFVKKARSFYADKIIAVSNKVADRLIKDCFYPAKKIVVIQNGVKWQEFIRNEDKSREFKLKNDIPENACVFGMITRLSEEKGIDIAINALHSLLKNDLTKPVFLVIAGEGREENKLKDTAKKLNLEKNINFLGFIQKPQNVLSACDVILLPSRLEGLPLGLLEGMAAGCIPIVTRISGMPEVVNSTEIGWVIDPENPEALSKAMYEAINLDTRAIMRMRNNAINRIKTCYDLAQSHQKFMEVLNL